MSALCWRVLHDTTLTGALLRDLQGLWDPASGGPAASRSLLDEVEHRFGVLVAEDRPDGRMIGAALGGYSDGERLGVLDYVFVAPEHRGRGLGRA
ncbi:MAG: GNAT family N-acetyltransferase, partial [Naasia sp.]